VPPEPTQLGAIKLPSWLPCTPNTLLAVAPGAGNCQPQQLVNWKLVPGLAPVRVPTFHWLVIVTDSGKFSVTAQLLNAVVPVLVTDTSSWKEVPPVPEGVAVQLCAANAWLPSKRLDSSRPSLRKIFIACTLCLKCCSNVLALNDVKHLQALSAADFNSG
jgi:hypothetical protein